MLYSAIFGGVVGHTSAVPIIDADPLKCFEQGMWLVMESCTAVLCIKKRS